MLARRPLTVDFGITLGFLAIFVWAIFQARPWPFRASLFPVLTAVAVLVVILLKLTLDVRAAQRQPTVSEQARLIDEEVAAEAELEDVFATAPRPVWLGALAWMAAFFLLLWTLGAFVTVPLFALLYLVLVSRESWPVAGVYAAVAWVFIYALFDQLLHIPLPTGALMGAFGA